jgi:hypothetical protein
VSRVKKQITREDAIAELWRQGVLDWKLSEVQKIMKQQILEDKNKISVILSSRRIGKTYLMCTLAIEMCLQKPGAVVKYAFPKQNMAKKMLLPVMRKILEDCPKEVKPEYMTAEKVFRFPNGSEIQISGTDNGSIENLRGGDSHLNLVDEAGFCSDLTYGVRSVLGPTTKITRGRTILISTPSRSENHEFITDWVLPYQIEGRIKVFTIFDNPNLTQESIAEALSEYPQGEKDLSFRREYLCEIARSAENAILPSLTAENEKVIVTDQFTRPIFYDAYVGLDVGGSDLTAVVFGYYDYLNATLVIEDEVVMGKEVNTKKLAELIKEKESQLWQNPIDLSPIPPYLRVSDNNNLILLTDMQRDHGLIFIPTRKDNREAAINSLDVAISQHKLIIHPRCTHTIYHMKFAEWNKTRTAFKNLKDSPSGQIKGGHADALAAIIYLHRNIIKSKNPYPIGYGNVSGSNVFSSRLKNEENVDNSAKSWIKSLSWSKKRDK